VSRSASTLALTLFSVCTACALELDTAGLAAEEVREPFIAFQRDFSEFMTWEMHELPDTGVRSGHGSLPPSFMYVTGARAAAFGDPLPVGTMIVRTRENGHPTEWTVHAMVKRGGGYNTGGATGWEWFDLRLDDRGAPFIVWRGEGDAADPGTYGPDVDGTPLACNDCHAFVPSNDFVFTRSLISE
jgi:hypothetical protein